MPIDARPAPIRVLVPGVSAVAAPGPLRAETPTVRIVSHYGRVAATSGNTPTNSYDERYESFISSLA